MALICCLLREAEELHVLIVIVVGCTNIGSIGSNVVDESSCVGVGVDILFLLIPSFIL